LLAFVLLFAVKEIQELLFRNAGISRINVSPCCSTTCTRLIFVNTQQAPDKISEFDWALSLHINAIEAFSQSSILYIFLETNGRIKLLAILYTISLGECHEVGKKKIR
jgi:hypothetical protein